jgi:SAM-dependent methyltransferase
VSLVTGRLRKPPVPQWLAEAETVDAREEVILPYTRSGNVLDVGVVDSRRAEESTHRRLDRFEASSLHAAIRRENPDVLGVDIDGEGVDILRERGYDVVCADVETMDLGRRFDTVVAGEVIEHLPNPGRALLSLRRHLVPSGHLILTTCNPFYVVQLEKILKYGDVQVHEEHTAWFDPRTLGHLLTISGFTVKCMYWIRRTPHAWWKVWPARLRNYFTPTFLLVAGLAGSVSIAEPSPPSISLEETLRRRAQLPGAQVGKRYRHAA